jgi:predicted Zn-dependent protease
VVLEPQAVATLTDVLLEALQSRPLPESGPKAFTLEFDKSLERWRTRLGLRVIDERLTFDHDPMHDALGILPFEGLGPMTWIKNGVLQAMSHDRKYALAELTQNLGRYFRNSYRMSGGTATVDQLIAGTRRGVLVTRFAKQRTLDAVSLVTTGFTRDGLWLIENGAITKSIKNMRFTESPLFVFNQIEELGIPVPVFNPSDDGVAPRIVPALRVRDFSFVSTMDGV